MSFYTNNKPRLIEPHIAKKLLILHNPPKPKPKTIINYKKINNCIFVYFKRNWSFICIILVLALLLIYRYKINQKENEMKKARKNYLDKLIMDNYMRELNEENKYNMNNSQPIALAPLPQDSNIILEEEQPNLYLPQVSNQPISNQLVNENVSDIDTQYLKIQKQENDNIVDEALAIDDNISNHNQSFDQIFQNNLDNTFSPFEGNSSYAPF